MYPSEKRGRVDLFLKLACNRSNPELETLELILVLEKLSFAMGEGKKGEAGLIKIPTRL